MIKANILIFEDEFITGNDLRKQLTALGYKVVGLFSNATQGLEFIEQNKGTNLFPDVVVMDIILRGRLDGVDTMKLIIQNYGCGVVFVTGLSQFDLIEEVMKTKPLPYLIKPVDITQAHIGIQIAFYQSKLEKEIRLLREELNK
jgi:DNA-binding NtrC family response regulator